MYALASPWRPLVSPGLRGFVLRICVPGAALGGVMYALPSPGVPWAPALSACNLHGKHGTWCSARGVMYALASLASLGLRHSLLVICVAGAALGALQGA